MATGENQEFYREPDEPFDCLVEVPATPPAALGLGLCVADYPPEQRAELDRDLAEITRQKHHRPDSFYTESVN